MEEADERGHMDIVQYLRREGTSDVNVLDYNWGEPEQAPH